MMDKDTGVNEERLKVLLSFLSEEFAAGGQVDSGARLVPDVVDSLGVFVLVDFVESRWGVLLAESDLTAETLASAKTLCRLIDSKDVKKPTA